MEISDINIRLSSLAWTSSNGIRSDNDIRIFPSAKAESQVIGAYDRFAADAQRFEVVSQDGQVFVRPWLPSTSQAVAASFGSVDEEDCLSKAA